MGGAHDGNVPPQPASKRWRVRTDMPRSNPNSPCPIRIPSTMGGSKCPHVDSWHYKTAKNATWSFWGHLVILRGMRVTIVRVWAKLGPKWLGTIVNDSYTLYHGMPFLPSVHGYLLPSGIT